MADPGGGTRGIHALPHLFLDQTEARRAEKKFGDHPLPPNLRVWITAPQQPLIWRSGFGTFLFIIPVRGSQWGLTSAVKWPKNSKSCQPSKKIIFYRQPSKMRGKINHKKVSEYFKSHYFSGSWRISKLEKPVPRFSKTLFLNINNTLQPAYIWKYFKILQVKSQGNTVKQY